MTDTAKGRFPAHAATFDNLNRRSMAGHGQASAAPAPLTEPELVLRFGNPPVTSYGSQALSSLLRLGDGRVGQTRAAKEVGDFCQCLANSARPRSLDLAYERAWWAYNLDRSLESLAYFAAVARAGMGGAVCRATRVLA